MKKIERTALMDTIAIMALAICAVVGVCLAIDWLRLYLLPIIVVVGGIAAFGFLFYALFEHRIHVNTPKHRRRHK